MQWVCSMRRLTTCTLKAVLCLIKGCMCLDGSRAPDGGWETTANVVSHMQILLILALATADVQSAFTQVELENCKSIWLCPLQYQAFQMRMDLDSISR
jgi:hypothetical protein